MPSQTMTAPLVFLILQCLIWPSQRSVIHLKFQYPYCAAGTVVIHMWAFWSFRGLAEG